MYYFSAISCQTTRGRDERRENLPKILDTQSTMQRFVKMQVIGDVLNRTDQRDLTEQAIGAVRAIRKTSQQPAFTRGWCYAPENRGQSFVDPLCPRNTGIDDD